MTRPRSLSLRPFCMLLALAFTAGCGSSVVGTDLECGEGTPCDGVCRDTRFDPEHCGACGNSCDADHYCTNGTCQPTCGSFTACDGVCRDTDVDPKNCGACGHECGEGEVCLLGSCELTCGSLTACDGVCRDT
ncbi:MAG: hypothetical protein GXY23_13970, partial [Myxococcales bacterium]|nr:hypothetical protein [Myxococcales bacterium]